MIIFTALGIIASVFQLVILRELNFSVAKQEFVFILACGAWIIFCAAGSKIRPIKKIPLPWLALLAGITFSLSLCLIHTAKALSGIKYYEPLSLPALIIFSLLLTGPAALVIGLGFAELARSYAPEDLSSAGAYANFFAFEAIGFFTGGLLFTFLFRDYSNPLVFSLLPLILLPVERELNRKIKFGALIIAVAVISSAGFGRIMEREFDGSRIIFNRGSGYGPVIAAEKAGVTSIFSSGALLATSEDKAASEEFIHMSLSALPAQEEKEVLFIGSALSGQIEEIAKHKLKSLDCLQINPLITELARGKKLPEEWKNKINFITADPRSYLKKTAKRYDAVLMNMPPPSNFNLNRYFTGDFFKLVCLRLKPKGIFSFPLPSKREILSPQFVRFDSSIINALDKAFPHRLIIPSDSMLLIASRENIPAQSLLDNFSAVHPKTEFFTLYHFRDYLDPAMRLYVQDLIDKKIEPNSDLNPSGLLNYLALEQAKFYPNLRINLGAVRRGTILLFLLAGLLALGCRRFSPRVSCLLNAGAIGFTSISLSSVIFVSFALFCGELFWKLGLLIAFFMAATALGTFFAGRLKNEKVNFILQLFLSWTILLLVLFFKLEAIGEGNYAQPVFFLCAFFCGFLTGSAYPLLARQLRANKFQAQNIATTIYAADLTGAFLGSFACGLLLVPFLGIGGALLILVFHSLV